MKRLSVVFSGVLALLLGLLSTGLVRRYVVEGRSMLRALSPGDRLLVESLTYRLREPRLGEIVVIRQPGAVQRLDIKRLAARPGSTVMVLAEERVLGSEEWYVLGDNLSESQDSRTLGPIETKDIVGRAWLKY